MKTLRPFLILVCLIALGACSRPGPASAGAGDVDYYTPAMHPSRSARRTRMRKRPICGMDLVPVLKADAQAMTAAGASRQPHEFSIPLERQQLIGVTYAAAQPKALRRTLRAVGTSGAYDGQALGLRRARGRLHSHPERRSPGGHRGEGTGGPAAGHSTARTWWRPGGTSTSTSCTCARTARREKNTATPDSAERRLAGARARLRQWNISDSRVDAVEKAGRADEYLPLNSPFDGVVEEVSVHQGRHVAVGDHLVDIVDLSSVWVWAEFYENELPLLKEGTEVTVTSSAIPGLSIAGKIAAVDPVR